MPEPLSDLPFAELLSRVAACELCRGDMPNRPRPIFQLDPRARVLVASQAPGNLADTSGIPFNDPSGERLRDWMGVSRAEFYDPSRIAILPMGFCFPGYDAKGGDLPPMKRCAETWRETLLARLPDLRVRLLIGGYSQKWHMPKVSKNSLTERVRSWRDYAPESFLTPHPSWRNNAWLKKNPWFEAECLPEMKRAVREALHFSS
jgi:uracil-DNA glycosylase